MCDGWMLFEPIMACLSVCLVRREREIPRALWIVLLLQELFSDDSASQETEKAEALKLEGELIFFLIS